MSVVSCREITEGQGGSRDKKNRTYKRVFLVVVNDQFDDQTVAEAAVGIPNGASYYFGNGGNVHALCVGMTPERIRAYLWRVEVNYSTDSEEQQDELDFTPIFGLDWLEETLVIDFSPVTGNAIVNGAGMPFASPAKTMQRFLPVITCEKNVPWSGMATLNYYASFNNKINASDWAGFPAQTLKCLCRVQQTEKKDSQTGARSYYGAGSFRLIYRPETWKDRDLNAGFQQYEVDELGNLTGKLVNIKDAKGVDVTTPWPLTPNGIALAPGFTAGINYIETDVCFTANFNGLPFGG